MMHRILALALVLLAGSSALAAKSQVVDNAGFFSERAVQQANQQLADLEQKHARHMRIETYDAIPSDLRGDYSEQNKRQFFQSWTQRRLRAEGINGVMVLICKNPSTLQVEVARDALSNGVVTQAQRTAIRDALLNSFRAEKYDQGLLNAVATFSPAVEANRPAAGGPPAPYRLPEVGERGTRQSGAPPAPAPVPQQRGPRFGGIFMILAIVFVGFWIIRKLFGGARSRDYGHGYRGGYPNQPPGHPGHGGYGGGGFGRGVGGGLLGGLLGSWVGHQVFGRHHDSGPSAPPTNQGGFGNQSDVSGGDAYSGGGDFGGGGGDADSGGGDF